MTTDSRHAGEPALPWRSGRTFRLWRYGVGHSQLLLRSPGDGGRDTLAVLFEAVEFMRLRRSYADLVLRLATEDEEFGFEETTPVPIPRLRLALESPQGTGLVVCSRVTARKVANPEDDGWADGTVLFWLVAGRLA